MNFSLLVLFFITFLPAVLLPGPNAAFAVAQSLKYGARKSIFAVLGFTAATAVLVTVVFSGLGVLAQRYIEVFIALKWVGIVYLIYLAYKMFNSSTSVIDVQHENLSARRMFSYAMFVSCTNPKAIAVGIILFPLFIDTSLPFLPQAISIGILAMSTTLCVYGGYIVVAERAATFFETKKNRMNKIVGSLYLGAAGALAASR